MVMANKQLLDSLHAPDGSQYASLTDGVGNLVVTTTSGTGSPKQLTNSGQAPDGSIYLTLTNGSGALV